MTSWYLFVNKILMLAILFGSTFASADARISGFGMQHCTSEQICLELRGPTAKQSLFGQMWFLKDSSVALKDMKTNRNLREWSGKTVFIDQFADQVIIRDLETSKEWQILLNDLKVTEFNL